MRNGSPQLTGTSSVLGISVLGKELPVDRAVSQTVSLVDSSSIDPSNLTPAQLGLPGVPLDRPCSASSTRCRRSRSPPPSRR